MTSWTPSGRLTSAQRYETLIWIQKLFMHTFCTDSIHISCNPMHIPYLFHTVNSTHTPYTFHVNSMHTICVIHTHSMYILCTFYSSSIQNPKINVYRLCVLVLPYIWIGSVWNLYGSAPVGWCESSDFRLSCIVSSRKNKFTIRISNDSFQCLVKHLQVSITY